MLEFIGIMAQVTYFIGVPFFFMLFFVYSEILIALKKRHRDFLSNYSEYLPLSEILTEELEMTQLSVFGFLGPVVVFLLMAKVVSLVFRKFLGSPITKFAEYIVSVLPIKSDYERAADRVKEHTKENEEREMEAEEAAASRESGRGL